jgi:hypothetical protein
MEPDFQTPVDRSSPRHFWASDESQFRVKVRQFSRTPGEFTIQRINFDRELDRYMQADAHGQSSCFPPRRGKRIKADTPRSEESLERSQRRSKTMLRLLVTELAPNHFCTFTIREHGPDYFKPQEWGSIWSSFVHLVRKAGTEFEYVAVLERHPTNPAHLHLHVAIRGSIHYNFLRRLWHMAICAHRGQRITKMLRGSDAPGNIQDRPVKAARGTFKQVRKIAKYMSKYMTKDMISEFNKRRYWPSKGINLAAAQIFWLDALSMTDAIREACLMLGQWDDEVGLCPQKLFHPSDRVVWCAIDPADTPPPPF